MRIIFSFFILLLVFGQKKWDDEIPLKKVDRWHDFLKTDIKSFKVKGSSSLFFSNKYPHVSFEEPLSLVWQLKKRNSLTWSFSKFLKRLGWKGSADEEFSFVFAYLSSDRKPLTFKVEIGSKVFYVGGFNPMGSRKFWNFCTFKFPFKGGTSMTITPIKFSAKKVYIGRLWLGPASKNLYDWDSREPHLPIHSFVLKPKKIKEKKIIKETRDILEKELTEKGSFDELYADFKTIEKRISKDLIFETNTTEESVEEELDNRLMNTSVPTFNINDIRRGLEDDPKMKWLYNINTNGVYRVTKEGFRIPNFYINVNYDLRAKNGYGVKLDYLGNLKKYLKLYSSIAHLDENSSIKKRLRERILLGWNSLYYVSGDPTDWFKGEQWWAIIDKGYSLFKKYNHWYDDYIEEAMARLKILDFIYNPNNYEVRYRDIDAVRLTYMLWFPGFFSLKKGIEKKGLQKKLLDVYAYKTFLENFIFNYGEMRKDGLKPDGTGYHHSGFISTYYFHALTEVSQRLYYLSQTRFAIKPEKHFIFKKALTKMFMFLKENSFGISMFPEKGAFDYTKLKSIVYGYMALAGDPKTGDKIDRDMAAMYMYFVGEKEKEGIVDNILKEIKKAYPNLKANRADRHAVLPWGAAATHRYNNTRLTVRGLSKYTYVHESKRPSVSFSGYGLTIFEDVSAVPRKYTWGKIKGIKPNNEQNIKVAMFGKSLEDIREEKKRKKAQKLKRVKIEWKYKEPHSNEFCFYPGTTTVRAPYEDYIFNTYYSKYYSEEPFLGGTSLDGRGVFALKLSKIPSKKYKNNKFKATKSYFMFEDTVVCLGRDISSDIPANVITNLFMNSTKEMKDFPLINGRRTFLGEKGYDLKRGVYFFQENHSRGYYVPPNKGRVVVRNVEKARQVINERKGEYITRQLPKNFNFFSSNAWIDHRLTPHEKKYTYIVKSETNLYSMNKFVVSMQSSSPPIVIKNGAGFQFVQHKKSKFTAAVFFTKVKSKKSFWEGGYLKSVSDACTVVEREIKKDEEIRFSIAYPDINTKEGFWDVKDPRTYSGSVPKKINFILRGKWSIDKTIFGEINEKDTFAYAKKINKLSNVTEFEVNLVGGTEVVLHLKKEK